MQGTLNVLVGLFRRTTLLSNVSKSNPMNCHPVEIQLVVSREAFSQHRTGEGATHRERLWRFILCPDHGVEIIGGYLRSHRRRLHGTNPEINWYRMLIIHTKHLSQVYEVIFTRISASVSDPSQGDPGRTSPEAASRITSIG